MTKKQNLLKGFIKENPLFVTLLGTCPALATTTSIESALGMGALFLFVLIGSNVFISLLRKIIPSEVKIPCYIVVIATFVTIVKMLSEAFLPELYSSLGVFISLIVVNCIVLGRAEAYASKNVIIAIIREFLGTGGFTFGEVLTFLPHVSFTPLENYAISFFTMPVGAFLVLGGTLAVIAAHKNKKEEVKAFNEKQEKLNAMRNAVKSDTLQPVKEVNK